MLFKKPDNDITETRELLNEIKAGKKEFNGHNIFGIEPIIKFNRKYFKDVKSLALLRDDKHLPIFFLINLDNDFYKSYLCSHEYFYVDKITNEEADNLLKTLYIISLATFSD
jgi:hypothetical protein